MADHWPQDHPNVVNDALAWCQIHHIIAWAQHGETRIDNLLMLCAVHHRLVHHSGWQVRITGGRPEFVPPGWIDPLRRPRRKPDLTRVADLDTLPDPATPGRTADLTALPELDVWSKATAADVSSEKDARPSSADIEVPALRSLGWDPDDAADAGTTRGLVGAAVELGRPAVRIVDFTDLDPPG